MKGASKILMNSVFSYGIHNEKHFSRSTTGARALHDKPRGMGDPPVHLRKPCIGIQQPTRQDGAIAHVITFSMDTFSSSCLNAKILIY